MMYGADGSGVAVRFLARTLEVILPDPCFVCRRRRASRHGLCPACHGQLRPIPWTCCPGCGRVEPDRLPSRRALHGERCARCLLHPPPWESLVAAWSYEPPLDGLVQALKFGRCEVLAPLLGEALADEVGHRLDGYEVVTSVPLHWWRRLQRGYDQAELIARALARRMNLPWLAALRRSRATPPQVGLDHRRRRTNVAGAFASTRPAGTLVASRRVLLVDDVVTTGATAGAACRALLSAGASSVTVVAVARAPSHGGAGG